MLVALTVTPGLFSVVTKEPDDFETILALTMATRASAYRTDTPCPVMISWWKGHRSDHRPDQTIFFDPSLYYGERR